MHHADWKLGDSLLKVLSRDPELRKVELEFLRRMLQAARASGAAIPPQAEDRSFELDLATMQTPIFQDLAHLLEHSVPEAVGFGRFRGNETDSQ